MRLFIFLTFFTFLLFGSKDITLIAFGANSKEMEEVLKNEELTKISELEKEILQNKIEILEKENGILQGNLTSVISLFGVIIAVLSIVFIAVGFWYKKNIEDKNEKNMTIMENKVADINTIKDVLNEDKKNIHKELEKIKDLRKELNDFRTVSNDLQDEILNNTKSNKEVINYMRFLEYRIQKSETVYKFLATLKIKRETKKEIEIILNEKNFDSEKTLEEIHKKQGEGIVEWDENVEQIINYYFTSLEREEKEILKQINKKFSYERYIQLKDDEEDTLLEDIEIDTHFDEWNQIFESISEIYELLKNNIKN